MHQTCEVCDAVIQPEDHTCPSCGRTVRPIWAVSWPTGEAEASPAETRPARPWGSSSIDPSAEFLALPIIPVTTPEPPRSWKFLWVMLIGVFSAAALLLHAAANDSSPAAPTEPVLPVAGEMTGTVVAQEEEIVQAASLPTATQVSVMPTAPPAQAVVPTHPLVESLDSRRSLAGHEQEVAPVVPTPQGDGTGGAAPGEETLPPADHPGGRSNAIWLAGAA